MKILDQVALENSSIDTERLVEIKRDSKYMLIFKNPLTMYERENIRRMLDEWLSSSDKQFALIDGAEVVIIQ